MNHFDPGELSQDLPIQPTNMIIYADGGFDPRTGIGGYGVLLRIDDTLQELSGGFRNTTANRMELIAVIAGLEAIDKTFCRSVVQLFSDSRYVTDAVNLGWLFRWKENGWKGRKGQKLDLWKRFMSSFLKHDVTMIWVKGHAGIVDNEYCDRLATDAIKRYDHPPDLGHLKWLASRHSMTGKKPATGYGDKSGKRKRSRKKNPGKEKLTSEILRGRLHAVVERKLNRWGKVFPHPMPRCAGDPCHKCGTPVVQRNTTDSKYYRWYLACERCRRTHHRIEAKVRK